MSSSDSPVFTALYKQYQSQLISRITRLVGCRETAADLAQEAYIRLLGHRDLSNILSLSAYLFRIGHNLAMD
ncbi:MAG: RNA polymerase subunit sigma, partial [Nitrosomonas sp. PRO5]|nr:RNA polymerase subunit sigma [Nitrosomonas sp. PRO5]